MYDLGMCNVEQDAPTPQSKSDIGNKINFLNDDELDEFKERKLAPRAYNYAL
jgi:hypothetical protein